MRPPHPDSEEALENATIELFSQLHWETANCYHENFGTNSTLGRETKGEVVLIPKLRTALHKLNPDIPTEAIQLAIEELTRDRSTLSLANANSQIYQLLKDGAKVTFKNDDGEDQTETVKVIDWNKPENNNFFLASQFWVTGEIYTRRADLVGFVNGLPLVFIELKAHHKRLELAYKNNLTDYKQTIPQLFWYNAFIILSNGTKSRIGSLTAKWDHFCEWKKINSEGEEGIVSLDTIIRSTCEKTKLLDIVENFIFFYLAKGTLVKIIAKNHQYLGVNQAVTAVQQIKSNQGKLGVFWHTQGSGKSYSMVFFSQKVLRKLYGNWTFVIITDREDLDEQIYKNFAYAGAVTEIEKNVRASNGEHLKKLLNEDHRYIFTMIQKFRIEKGGTYPLISPRSDIIVIADEAHRSQYDTFALNMRNALPNAAFIGFTGTPLMIGEQETKKTFGDYISIYNFKQSIEDGATVPLYYENRIPERIDFSQLKSTTGFVRTKFWKDAVESIIVNDESKRTYLSLAGYVHKLYKAILPDPAVNEFTAIYAHFERIIEQIRSEVPDVDISEVMEDVEELLDQSITAGEFVIQESHSQQIDLRQIDFEALKIKFASTEYQRTETEKLKALVNSQLQQMVRLNKSRLNYLEKFQQIISEYNTGSRNVEMFFNDLINFAQELDTEDKRAISQNLTEEELAVFDLLTKPEIKLNKQEEQEVKQVARELLAILKKEKLVLDWRKRQQTRASVEVAIKDVLDKLPENYSIEIYEQKCQEVYQHVYENYSGQSSIYDSDLIL